MPIRTFAAIIGIVFFVCAPRNRAPRNRVRYNFWEELRLGFQPFLSVNSLLFFMLFAPF